MKIFYRILFLMILATSTFQGFAYDFEADGIYYNINVADKTASVTKGNIKYEGDIVIPKEISYRNAIIPVTEIEEEAFWGSDITTIDLPTTITSIGFWALYACKKLEKVIIHDLEAWLKINFDYEGCNGLGSGGTLYLNDNPLINITIPESITEIRDYTFCNYSKLESVNIPNSVTSIGRHAFDHCKNLVSVDLSNYLISIKSSAFSGCTGLISIDLPNSLISIDSSAFEDCKSLTSIELPETFANIKNATFKNCKNLVSINMPEALTKIEGSAFEGCSSLNSVELPNTLTEIGKSAFKGCVNLNIPVDFPTSLIEIGESAFKGCSSLTRLKLPSSLKTIGDYAFSDCTGIISLEIPNFNYIDLDWFTGSKIQKCILNDSPDKLIIRGPKLSSPFMANLENIGIEEIYLGRDFIYYDKYFKRDTSEGLLLSKELRILSLGKDVTDVSKIILKNSENLEIINSFVTYPPSIGNCSNSQYATVEVNIRKGCLEYYMDNAIWKNFWNYNENLELNVSHIELNYESATLEQYQTLQLVASILPPLSNEESLSWLSSNPSVATVSENGLVTALNGGTTVITASYGELSAECIITVNGDAGVDDLILETSQGISIYSMSGLLIRKNCQLEDLQFLSRGFYIIASGKKRFKISI